MTLRVRLSEGVVAKGKRGYVLPLVSFPRGDHVGNAVSSRVVLFEDGKPFGQAHSGLTSVCEEGNGLFVHWENNLYFSTPDNTNLFDNGRVYEAVWDDERYYRDRADYFFGALSSKMARAGLSLADLSQHRLLEIGCGRHHGLCLLAVGFGADVVAADRYAPIWDEAFHPGFIKYLTREGGNLWKGFDGERLAPLLRAGGFTAPPFVFHPIDAETLRDFVDEPFTLQMSCAALEHFYDLDKVFAMLSSTAATGAIASHNVDFRDHRDFARPLDFLLIADEAYDALCGDEKYVHGNRVRPHEFEALFDRHGFQSIVATNIATLTDAEYLSSFIPRLRASSTRFSGEAEESLIKLGVDYVARKVG